MNLNGFNTLNLNPFPIIRQELGNEWKKLSDDDKKPFQEQSAEEKKKYETAMERWKQSEPYKKYEADLTRVTIHCSPLFLIFCS